MSTIDVKQDCQDVATIIRNILTPYYTEIAATVHEKKNAHATLPPVSNTIFQLYAATFSESEMSKIVVEKDQSEANQAHSAIQAIDTFFSVTHSWHELSSELSEQEREGIIQTPTSIAYHELLFETSLTKHFILSKNILESHPPSKEKYAESIQHLTTGERITQQDLVKKLVEQGYERHKKSLEQGSIRVRGEQIDISHPIIEGHYTVTFLGSVIESIVHHTGQRSAVVTSVRIPPVMFPEETTSWSNILADRLVLSQDIAPTAANCSISFSNSASKQTFPLTEHNEEVSKLFVLYQNRDRVESVVRDHPAPYAELCPSPLAEIPLQVSSTDWTLRTEASFFPKDTAEHTSPISIERARELIGELTAGKPAVHADHGIGIYEGLEKRNIEGFEREYLMLRYAEGDLLATPVEIAHKLTPYVGETSPTIHRMGGTLWQQVKKKAKEDAAALARELLKISQERSQATRKPYAIAERDEEKLEADFPFTLTEDQQKTLTETLQDMSASQPMDRLIVGDVGFGKTEIAIRAAFHAIQNGKQVAVLAPTTLLVQQHLDTFQKRLSNTKSSIHILSRFTSAKDQKSTKEAIQDGSAQIVVGTHALLSKSVQWKNLGLVVIDEEQRFGVKQKEHFKKIRSSVDVLSLSATPIPRTLSMALSGLRSLSVITTAPEGRQAIKTYVKKADDELIKRAIEREQKRGGQMYIVAPKIRQLSALAEKVKELAPSARIEIAHGQLSGDTLSDIVHRFDAGEIDILISSSIVENGLDLPNANTLIVWGAPHFGLASLYQLRGRVGRRSKQGYAYFLYGQQRLTPIQRKRLTALTQASRLGSGWEIARQDLEIRGAGNLLGSDQSGSVASVGVHLYLDMIEQAADTKEQESEIDVKIELPLPAVLPTHYILDSKERTRWYRRITKTKSKKELNELQTELEKTYGPLPEEALGLLQLIRLRGAAAKNNITAVESKVISPSDEDPYDRLIITSTNPRATLEKIHTLGTFTSKEHSLSLDVDAITSRLVDQLIAALS